MNKLTEEQYKHQVADCDGLCVITDEMLEANTELMKCVRCPFCSKIVDAILTETYIACPECKVTVGR